MTLLKEIVEKNLYLFADEAKDWKDSIKMSCWKLEEYGAVDETYSGRIIECVEKFGPYIVLIPGVAMPHSQEGADGVMKTEIGFMKLEKPVSFDESDPEKDATLFFTLASCNNEEHLKNMGQLAAMLSNEEIIAALHKAQSKEDLLQISEQYMN